jgi:hypothetical protein
VEDVVAVGEGVAVAVGVADAFDVGGEPAIAHEVADDVQVLGMVKVPLSVIPTVAEAPGARAPFQEALVTRS